jgi:hypothetical protein
MTDRTKFWPTDVLESAVKFNETGLVYGSGDAAQERDVLQEAIKRQEKLVREMTGQVAARDERMMRKDLAALKKAHRHMASAVKNQTLIASGNEKEKSLRTKGRDGIYEVDGAIMEIFQEASDLGTDSYDRRINNGPKAMAREHLQYEGDKPKSLPRTSISKID